MKDIFSIKDKIVVITGASGGIGNAIATGFAENESIVYGIDLKIPKNQKKLSNIFYYKCDITKQKQFSKICKTIFKKHNRIDVLVNCAGISLPLEKPHQKYSQTNWLKTIEINLTASFYCTQSVIPYMIKNHDGSIINITSINAELGFPRNPSYVASKGGLKMLGKSFAKDWGSYGIRVNNIGPGYIKTNMTKKTYSNKTIKKQREMHTMLGRWGLPEDLVGPCIFLASAASNYITGQDIYVDGGWIPNSIITE